MISSYYSPTRVVFGKGAKNEVGKENFLDLRSSADLCRGHMLPFAAHVDPKTLGGADLGPSAAEAGGPCQRLFDGF